MPFPDLRESPLLISMFPLIARKCGSILEIVAGGLDDRFGQELRNQRARISPQVQKVMKTSGRASSAVKRALSSQQNGGLGEDIRLYAGIVHQLHVGIAIWHLENLKDLKTFHLIFANPAAEKYLSVPSETVYGKTIAGIFPDFFDTQLPKIFQEVALSGEAKDLGEVRYGDERVPDGIFTARVYPLPDHCVCVTFEDLTEQRKVAGTISNRARLLDLATDSIFALDMDGRVTYWNQGAERMYGWTKQEVNRSCSDGPHLKP